MNTVFKSFSIVVAGLAMSAHAQDPSPQNTSPWSAEVGYSVMSFTNTSDSGDSTVRAQPGALTLAVGYRVHPNVVLEGTVGLGVTQGKVKWDGVDYGRRVKANTYGVFVRPTFPINEQFELFGRLGYLQSRVSDDSGSYSGGRFSYGLGLNFNVSKTSYLQATWTKGFYKDNDEPNLKVSAIGFAYGMRF
jgi:hypothetical protein